MGLQREPEDLTAAALCGPFDEAIALVAEALRAGGSERRGARRPRAAQRCYRAAKARLTEIGFTCEGSLIERYNRHALEAILDEMRDLSRQAAERILASRGRTLHAPQRPRLKPR